MTAYGYARRSLHAARDIPKGLVIEGNMLLSKRPGHGIRPKYLDWVVGRRAARDIARDSWITMDMLD
jgi:sialic acid synthase SpsE